MNEHPIFRQSPRSSSRSGRKATSRWSPTWSTTRPRSWPKRSTWSPTSACSTSPAAAATRRSPPPGAPGATWSAPTTSRPCSSAGASARRRSGWRSSSSRPTPRTSRSRTPASTSRCRSTARCSPPTRRRPRPSCCAWSNRAAASGWATGAPTAPSARCSRRSPSTPPPPPGLDSPLLWGTEERLRELFGDGISDLRVERRVSRQPFRSADHYIEFFRTYFGPTQTAYERVGPEGEQALTDDLRAFLEAANTAGERGDGARGRLPRGDRDPRLDQAGEAGQLAVSVIW